MKIDFMEQQIIEYITGLINKHIILTAILAAMGLMRFWFKPSVAIIRRLVAQTPWQWDDKLLAKVEASPIWPKVFWIFDWLTSIKILKLLLLTGFCGGLIGCKSTSFSRTSADGTILKARDMRFLTQTAAEIEATVSTNGAWTVKAKVQSSPQAEAIKAAAEGVAEGVTRGFNPVK